MKIENAIKYLREKEGLTQSEFAEKVNLKQSAISRYEANKADILYSNLINIVDQLGYNIVFEKKDDNNEK